LRNISSWTSILSFMHFKLCVMNHVGALNASHRKTNLPNANYHSAEVTMVSKSLYARRSVVSLLALQSG
jgi:hypothetical protein